MAKIDSGVCVRVLVGGGAGYIGSHTVVALVESGHDVVIADDFSNSKPTVVARLEQITGRSLPVHTVDLRDRNATDALFAAERVDAVIHFAGLKAVGDSVRMPVTYYEHNLNALFSVLRAMENHGVDTIVFSSSATVYGDVPDRVMHEELPLHSVHPYGWTKLMGEQVLRDVAVARPDLRVALLRYFNPVGAHPSGLIGEDPADVPNNLMPFLAQVAIGRRERLNVFGGDYDTPDGSGVRDFIHVDDLAEGHVAALEALGSRDEQVGTWNLGTGTGVSVLELLHAFERAVGRELPYAVVDRRPGDLPAYWADPSKANRELEWVATRTVDDMCRDTWRWQKNNPTGYPD